MLQMGKTGDVTDIEVDYTLVFDDTNDSENDEDDDENESDENDESTQAEPSGTIYAGNGYTVDVQIPQSWEHAYNAKLLITNTSDETLHNWGFLLKTDDDISGLYNATELSAHDGTRLFKNAGYNQDIPAGGTVEVGYTAYYGDSFDVPDEFALASFERSVEMPEYRVETFVTDEWDDGALAGIVIENISDKAIEDWKLEFDSDMNISRIWDGVLVSHDGDHYIIRNADYAQNIASGDRWTVGLEINGSISDIENVIMTEIAVTDEAQPSDETTVSENTVSENTVSENSVSENTVSENNADPDEMDYETDTDGDGIPDAYEEYFGTDKNDPDTDDDGLTDYEEIFVVGTDPTVYDSVTSGISDYDADIDGDGISNGAELQAGLDPLNEDSDFDGLKDGEEAGYGTDPLNPDTDGEGLDDGDDIALGFSPLMKDTDGNGVLDCDEKVWQTYNHTTEDDEKITEIILNLHASGKLDKTTEVDNIMGRDVMSSGVVGLIGNPYDISTESSFDSGTIAFRINTSVLDGTDIDDLGVLWYDETNDRFEIMDSVWDADEGVLRMEITHFSRYMVVDKELWFAAWRQELAYTVSSDTVPADDVCFDTILVVDCSGSMNWNDHATDIPPSASQPYWLYDCYRYKVTNNFVLAMQEGDRTGVVTFTGKAQIENNLTDNKDIIHRSLRSFGSIGDTSYDAPLQKAYEMLVAHGNPESVRQIIFISDGESSVQPDILNALNAAHIKVHTVCLGEPVYKWVLVHISEQTGGTFFDAYKATEVVDMYAQFGMDEKYDETDTDGDGLPDAVEAAGIRIANGSIIYTDPTEKDTDGDNLLDGEEIDPEMELITYTDLALQDLSGWYFHMKSDPRYKDSDDDGYEDGDTDGDEEVDDPRPLWNDIRVISLKSDYVSVDVADTKTPGQGNATYYNGSVWEGNYPLSGNMSFGGDQNWFRNLNNPYKSDLIADAGCGLIAMSDVNLYLSLSNSIFSNGDVDGLSTANNIGFDDYVEYVEYFNNNYVKLNYVIDPSIDWVTVDGRMGIIMSEYWADESINMSAEWIMTGLSSQDFYYKSEEMLVKNIPVIFSIGPVKDIYRNIPLYGEFHLYNCPAIMLYETNDDINKVSSYSNYGETKSHYMTITGIVIDQVKMEKDEYDGVMYEASSWGNRVFISKQEYDLILDNISDIGINAPTSILYIHS